MSKIGEFVLRQEGSGAAGWWKADTYLHSFSGALFENDRRTEDAPAYRLFAKSRHGAQVEIGVAWEKRDKNQKRFFSIQLNHPEIFPDAPLNMAAFAMENSPDVYEIVLSRPRQATASAA